MEETNLFTTDCLVSFVWSSESKSSFFFIVVIFLADTAYKCFLGCCFTWKMLCLCIHKHNLEAEFTNNFSDTRFKNKLS